MYLYDVYVLTHRVLLILVYFKGSKYLEYITRIRITNNNGTKISKKILFKNHKLIEKKEF